MGSEMCIRDSITALNDVFSIANERSFVKVLDKLLDNQYTNRVAGSRITLALFKYIF